MRRPHKPAPPPPASASAAGRTDSRSSAPTSTSFASTSSSTIGRATRSATCKQEDFEVTEDGKPQSIQTFKLVNVSEDAGVGSDPPREDPQRRSKNRWRRRATTCGCSRFSSTTTTCGSRTACVRARCSRSLSRTSCSRRIWPASCTRCGRSTTCCCRGTAGRSLAPSASSPGRKYDYTPRNVFEERYVHYVSTIEAERIRNQVTLSAIKGLIIRLGGLREGRKAIILVSEGFTNSLPSQVNDRIATCNGGACARTSRGRGPIRSAARIPRCSPRMESQEFFLQTDLLSDLRLRVRARESLQHRDLRCRSARARAVRVRSQHAGRCERQPDQGPRDARQHDRLAADPRRRNRRPRDRQQQRSRPWAAPDRPRLERVLPAGLHLDG